MKPRSLDLLTNTVTRGGYDYLIKKKKKNSDTSIGSGSQVVREAARKHLTHW